MSQKNEKKKKNIFSNDAEPVTQIWSVLESCVRILKPKYRLTRCSLIHDRVSVYTGVEESESTSRQPIREEESTIITTTQNNNIDIWPYLDMFWF